MARSGTEFQRLIVAAAVAAAVVFSAIPAWAGGRYKERPKHHFLSYESLKRPEDYRKLKKYQISDRRFNISKRGVVKLKKSSFWNFRPYQFSTPLVKPDKIYVGVDAGVFYGIDIARMRKLWSYETEGAVQAKAAAEGQDVFVGDCKGFIYSLDADKGTERWKVKLDTSVMAAPLVDGIKVYVATMSGRLYALDRATGVEVWHTDSGERDFGFTVRRQADPVMYNGNVFVGTSSGLIAAYNAASGNIVWARQIGDRMGLVADIDSTPLMLGDTMYLGTADGGLASIDMSSGGIIWQVGAGGTSDVAYYEGRLYSSGGDVLTAVDPATGNFIWQQEFDDPGLSSPFPGQKYLAIASTEDRLYLVDSDTGDVLLERYIRKGSYGDPVVVGDMLYILSNSGRLFAFKVKELPPRKKRKA
jgi:outer membrane protein assembly factor BamB